MENEIRKTIENSELHYTAGKLIDDETFNMMIDELVGNLVKLYVNFESVINDRP